jgi:TRAP-type C4-dicarboxylate transport system substrate-binding protein
VALTLTGAGLADEKIQIKVGHVNPPGDSSHDAWEFFKKTLEAKSNGRFAVSR